MKSRFGVARISVVACLSLSWMPAVADPPHRRVGGPSKRSKETTIHQSSGPELLWPLGGCEDAKSGMPGGESCPPIYGPSGIDGAYVGLDNRGKREVDMQIHAAGIALDRAERHAAEWGHASIASAVLVETHSQSDGFHIDANGTYKQFAESARKGRQGGASRLIEDTLKAKLEGKFGSDTYQGREDRIEELRQMTEFKREQYNLELEERRLQKLRRTPVTPPEPTDPSDADPTEQPAGETLPDGTSTGTTPAVPPVAEETPPPLPASNYASADLLPELGDTNVFVNSSFNEKQTTLQTAVPAQATAETPNLTELALLADHLQPSEGDVMKSAASNVVMQKILNYLTKPVRAGSDHVPWFMVTQVSVSPGSRTFRDYAAETTLHPYYAVQEEHTGRLIPQKDPKTVHPGIFAAFPLVEAQALDLRNSERYETQLSMAIAAKLLAEGKQAEAKFFLEKVTKVQQDIATRTMLPIVVPNSNGREVTYRFDPGLQALVDPGNRKKGSGMILQPNSVPALIVIMTDRKSLKCYPSLHFELHTRWIPKKKSSVWSATWDGIVRNYNPRNGMLPSDVIGAAASMDEAKRRLDWVTWKLRKMGVESAYDVALEQGRMRCSALMSKIGSYQSNISLPVHFNVLPNDALTNGTGLKLDSRYEQKIIVERVSGPELHSDLTTLSKVFIGGFRFEPWKTFEPRQRKVREAMERALRMKQDAEKLVEQSETAKIEGDSQNRVAQAKLAESAAKLQQAEAQLSEADLKNREAETLKERAIALQGIPTVLDADWNATRAEVQKLQSGSQTLKSDSLKLELSSFQLRSESQRLQSEARELQSAVREIQSTSRILKDESQILYSEFQAVKRSADEARGELGAVGYFESVDKWNAVITLPADRTWTLPTGTHAVTGEFGPSKTSAAPPTPPTAITFGTIKLSDLDAVTINPITTAVAIPTPVTAGGITVTVTGLNLNRVKSAYWASDLKPVDIVSQGKERLVLHIKTAPPKGTKEILISDTLAPSTVLSAPDYSRSIVGSVPVSVQEPAKTPLAVTSSALAFQDGVPLLKLEGSFPKGEVTVVIASDFLTRTLVKKVETDAKVLTVELERSFFSNVVGKEVVAKFTLTHPDGKAPVTGSFPLYDGTVVINGVAPFDFSASEINGDLDASIQVFGSFPTKDPIQVYIGGIQVALIDAKDIKSPLVIPLKLKPEDRFHTKLNSLKTKPGKKKLMLAFGGGLYEWKDELNISAD